MTARFNRRYFLVTGSAALTGSVFLKGCSNSPPSTTVSPTATAAVKQIKAAIVLPGVITDKAWNQAGYGGLTEIKTTLGIETAYVEKIGQAEQAEALSDFARRGFNLIYAHGGQFDAAVKQVATQFPDTRRDH